MPQPRLTFCGNAGSDIEEIEDPFNCMHTFQSPYKRIGCLTETVSALRLQRNY